MHTVHAEATYCWSSANMKEHDYKHDLMYLLHCMLNISYNMDFCI